MTKLSKSACAVCSSIAFAAAGAALAIGACPSESVEGVRQAIENVVSNLPQRAGGSLLHMKEFGFRNRKTAEYAALAQAVSNAEEKAWVEINNCATNELERMILLSAGWAYDDDYYLKCYSNVLALAEAGVLNLGEVRWFGEGSRNERRMNLLALRYDMPGISNLVFRLQAITGNTNYCQKILSGESKRLYLQYTEEMSYER